MRDHQENSISKKVPRLGILVPCCNEEPVLVQTHTEVSDLLFDLIQKNQISKDSFILYVDDGSQDKTWDLIQMFCTKGAHARGLKLSRNFGHQNALMAGMEYVAEKTDINICIDADLQHDIYKIPEFISLYKSGSEIVYGVKRERQADSFLKRASAQSFYIILQFFGAKIVYNHADFRLLSSRVLKELLRFREVNLFLRGVIPLLGFKSSIVYYDIKPRAAGESKYSMYRMLSLALDGVTSFSTTPLRMITGAGVIFFLGSIIASLISVYSYMIGDVVRGWSSLIITICFFGGVTLISLGIIGEYIGKIYKEIKCRPRYFIDQVVGESTHLQVRESLNASKFEIQDSTTNPDVLT
jgi:glycosyltransferase involved in cell wall biosynthesis